MQNGHLSFSQLLVAAVLCGSLCACSGMGGLVKREEALKDSHRRYQELLDRQRHRVDTQTPEPKRSASVAELLRDGDRLRDHGAADEAVWQFLRALRADPERLEARERIGFLHLHREPQRALSIFQKVIEGYPDRAVSHAGIALALLAEGELSGAEAAARRAGELDATLPLAWAALGTVLDQRGEHAEAQAALRHALELRPDEPSYLNNLGISYLRSDDGRRAEETFRLALRRVPADAALRNQLGVALSMQGRYREAMDVFRKGGGEQVAHNNLGAVHLWRGDYSLAAQQFEMALLAGGRHTEEVLRNLRATKAAMRRDAQTAPPASGESQDAF